MVQIDFTVSLAPNIGVRVKEYTSYVLEIRTAVDMWTVQKRYSDFHRLKEELGDAARKFADLFPPKTWFTTDDVVAHRMNQLPVYMAAIAGNEKVMAHPAFKSFLHMSAHGAYEASHGLPPLPPSPTSDYSDDEDDVDGSESEGEAAAGEAHSIDANGAECAPRRTLRAAELPDMYESKGTENEFEPEVSRSDASDSDRRGSPRPDGGRRGSPDGGRRGSPDSGHRGSPDNARGGPDGRHRSGSACSDSPGRSRSETERESSPELRAPQPLGHPGRSADGCALFGGDVQVLDEDHEDAVLVSVLRDAVPAAHSPNVDPAFRDASDSPNAESGDSSDSAERSRHPRGARGVRGGRRRVRGGAMLRGRLTR